MPVLLPFAIYLGFAVPVLLPLATYGVGFAVPVLLPLAKKEVTKSIRPTARKTDTEKYVAKGSKRTGTAKPKSATGRSTVLGTEVYSAKGKRTGTAKPTPYVAKGKRTGTAKPKYIAKGKRTGTAKPKYVAKGKRTGTAKQLAPIKSVRPIANTKNQMGYYEDKKKRKCNGKSIS